MLDRTSTDPNDAYLYEHADRLTELHRLRLESEARLAASDPWPCDPSAGRIAKSTHEFIALRGD